METISILSELYKLAKVTQANTPIIVSLIVLLTFYLVLKNIGGITKFVDTIAGAFANKVAYDLDYGKKECDYVQKIRTHRFFSYSEVDAIRILDTLDYSSLVGHDFSTDEKDKRLYNTKHMGRSNFLSYARNIRLHTERVISAVESRNLADISKYNSIDYWLSIYVQAHNEWMSECTSMKLNMYYVNRFYRYHSNNDQYASEFMRSVLLEDSESRLELEKVCDILTFMYSMVRYNMNSIHELLSLNGEVSKSYLSWEFPHVRRSERGE